MTGHRAVTSVGAAAALTLVGCGGAGEQRNDAAEKAASATVDVVEATFPARQRLGGQAQMRIAVKNTGAEPLRDVTVTVDSFSRRPAQPSEADSERPIWIVDEAPRGGTTALVNTWALPVLGPGETKSFRWKVTPVDAGSYRLRYTVGAGLDPEAGARGARGGSPLAGAFPVRVSAKPSAARVDPATGKVERVEE